MKNGYACLFLWESILFAHLTSFSLFGKRPFRELTVFIENLQKVSSSASVFACKSSQVLHGWVGEKTRKCRMIQLETGLICSGVWLREFPTVNVGSPRWLTVPPAWGGVFTVFGVPRVPQVCSCICIFLWKYLTSLTTSKYFLADLWLNFVSSIVWSLRGWKHYTEETVDTKPKASCFWVLRGVTYCTFSHLIRIL